jgi:branched-chain amino acid transport system ATP-binding protein
MSILALDNLHKQYGALSVTQDLSLEVKSGEIVGILGPNGAGKTTLFNLITGTVSPNSGRVVFDGRDVTALDSSQRCRLGISRSFQVPHPFVGMTVFENVEKRALDVMRLTGMGARANSRAGALTLLERKRLELARALAADPRLLLLDEIAGGLTDNECASLLDAIRDIHSTGVTIIWIEHVVHALISVARRLVVMDFGRKVIDGEPAEVMASREVQAIYMGEEDHG